MEFLLWNIFDVRGDNESHFMITGVTRVVKWIAKIAIIAKQRNRVMEGGSQFRKQRNRVSSLFYNSAPVRNRYLREKLQLH